ncbi:MAG: hypothetical protein II719_07885 [Clostridia bacterium]|nr:hypothetical protein [Clostridia bacterium]
MPIQTTAEPGRFCKRPAATTSQTNPRKLSLRLLLLCQRRLLSRSELLVVLLDGSKNHLYPAEIVETFPLAAHCLYYSAPLSALISLHGTSRITVDGARGEFLRPVPQSELLRLDQRRLSDERICTPSIRSYSVDLDRQTVECF